MEILVFAFFTWLGGFFIGKPIINKLEARFGKPKQRVYFYAAIIVAAVCLILFSLLF